MVCDNSHNTADISTMKSIVSFLSSFSSICANDLLWIMFTSCVSTVMISKSVSLSSEEFVLNCLIWSGRQHILRLKNPKTHKRYKVKFIVVDDKYTPLLGAKAIQAMNLITIQFQNIMVYDNSHNTAFQMEFRKSLRNLAVRLKSHARIHF
jgi:hypothetical protein